jgi:hypothetical protein
MNYCTMVRVAFDPSMNRMHVFFLRTIFWEPFKPAEGKRRSARAELH